MDFSNMSNDDLRKFIAEADQEIDEALQPGWEASNKRVAQEIAERKALGDTRDGRTNWELAGEGFKKSIADPLWEGPSDLFKTIFRANDSELEALNAERAKREEYDKRLMNNWPAQMGNFGGKALSSLIAPARLVPQVLLAATDSALSPSKGPIRGTSSALLTRLVQGAEGGASALLPGAALHGAGKLLGTATGRFTPEGVKAIALNDAANRIGVKRNVGSLDQSSGLNAFESSLPGYARTVEEQVKAFSDAARRDVAIPSSTGKSTTTRALEGEAVRTALVDSGKNLQDQGKALWNDLDDYIVQNNIAPVSPSLSGTRVTDISNKYTPIKKGIPRPEKNPILQRVGEYDEEASKMLTWMAGQNPKNYAIPFSHLHQIQSAVGKALARAERDASAAGASMMDRNSRTELKNLYGSLMTDVDKWGTKNPDAQKMFDEARGFWRDRVVPGVINNKLYSKASKGTYGMNPRGYSEAKNLYSDVVGNPTALSNLTDYMDPMGRDLVDTLTTMPDVSRALSTNTPHPQAPGMGTLTQMAGMLVGSPLQFGKAAVSHMPGFHPALQSNLAKKAYFARDLMKDTPLGRLSWGASRKPQQDTLEGIQDIRTGKQ